MSSKETKEKRKNTKGATMSDEEWRRRVNDAATRVPAKNAQDLEDESDDLEIDESKLSEEHKKKVDEIKSSESDEINEDDFDMNDL